MALGSGLALELRFTPQFRLMNATRLAFLANELGSELRAGQVVSLLNTLVERIQAAVNSPNENSQRGVQDTKTQLLKVLGTASSNRLSPGLRSDLDELKIGGQPAANLVGRELAANVELALASGPTSVTSLDELRKLHKQVEALSTSLETLKVSLGQLSINQEKLAPGQAVAGMTIPRQEVDGGLRELVKELRFLDRMVSTLSEALDETREEPKVVTLRSSDFGIDVQTSLTVAAAIAKIVAGVIDIFEKLKKLRAVKADAETAGLGKAVADEIDKKSQEVVAEETASIQATIVQEFKVTDAGRTHELKTAISFSIKNIADRMERGFVFEARAEAPKDASPEQEQLGQMVTALSSVRFERIEGARLLALPPAAADDADEDDDGDKGAKKRKKR